MHICDFFCTFATVFAKNEIPMDKDSYRKTDLTPPTTMRELWQNYHAEVLFFVLLLVATVASHRLSRFIPDSLFDNVFTPALNVCTFTVSFFGAWIIFRHSEGMRIRRLWGYALVVWGLGDLFYWLCYIAAPLQVMNMGAEHLTTYELLIGNLLGWVMVLYPTETLRPGWLNAKIVAWQLVPMAALVALDYIVPFDLWPLVALYPYALLALVLTHIRAYRVWCENNYSSMDNIDVQWIIRYCIMLFFVGANYVFMCSTHHHTRAFTQEWFVIFMLVYSTEQILFRKNPWANPAEEEISPVLVTADPSPLTPLTDAAGQPENVRLLEQWFSTEKPYLNPNFQLMDLMKVLPMNRTYLSRFLRDEFGCTFYQFVNKYRIEEAKRLMTEHPELKMTDVAAQCGFSSQSMFSSTFARETGLSPREWSKKFYSA